MTFPDLHEAMHIDGERVLASDGAAMPVIDPASGRIIGSVPAATVTDVDRAVEAARRSFSNGCWRGLCGDERQTILLRAAALLLEQREELAMLESWASGMLLETARNSVTRSAEALRHMAGFATRLHGQTTEMSGVGRGEFHAFTVREPVGVAALIVPWNFPIALALIKVGPALAAGCSVVIKPAEHTPFTALRIADLFEQAGVPPGVINVVTGEGEVVGAALAEHPGVDKVAFTGSTEVGKSIVRAASGNLKKVTLELGGKSPVLVLDDADLDRAVPGIAMGIFLHSGQVCLAGSRVYVARPLFEPLLARLAEYARSLTIGDPRESETCIGPVVSEQQALRIKAMIDAAVAGGARLVTGGKRLDREGFFIEPTVFADPPVESAIVREEIFGPVLTVMPFDRIDEAILAANDTRYGLAAAVWTRSVDRAHHVSRRLRAGIVWINCQFVTSPSLPGGGMGESGWGREMGVEGVDAYLQTKAVYAAIDCPREMESGVIA